MMKSIVTILLSISSLSLFGQVADSSLRKVYLQGAANFRDVGGYKTSDGKIVKWHKIYRSADISKLTDADLNVMAAKHINTVVDLRENNEQKSAPDRLLPYTKYINCAVPEMDGVTATWMANIRNLNSGDSMLLSFMKKTDHLKAKFKPLFDAMLSLSDTSALVYHCTAGKDRTGTGTALFLHALGVPYATIEADYLASNVYRAGENEKLIKMMSSMGIKENVAKDMAGVKAIYLQTLFDSIKENFGSIDKFLETELGLGKPEIKKLKKIYTE
jgi:protein-tyrosine phosphatase